MTFQQGKPFDTICWNFYKKKESVRINYKHLYTEIPWESKFGDYLFELIKSQAYWWIVVESLFVFVCLSMIMNIRKHREPVSYILDKLTSKNGIPVRILDALMKQITGSVGFV